MPISSIPTETKSTNSSSQNSSNVPKKRVRIQDEILASSQKSTTPAPKESKPSDDAVAVSLSKPKEKENAKPRVSIQQELLQNGASPKEAVRATEAKTKEKAPVENNTESTTPARPKRKRIQEEILEASKTQSSVEA